MATITPSALISEIRGSVGTQTFSRNKFRAYVKTRKTPTNPNTAKQISVRTNMETGVTEWQGFTDTERRNYEAIAKNWNTRYALDGQKPLTGYLYFMRKWLLIESYSGLSWGGDSPPRKLPFIKYNSLSASSTALSLVIGVVGSITNCGYIVKMTRPVSAGRMASSLSLYSPIDWADMPGTTITLALKTAYEARFGFTLASKVGKKIFVQIQVADLPGNYLSPPLMSSVIIT